MSAVTRPTSLVMMARVHGTAVACWLLASALQPGAAAAQESLDRAAVLASEADFEQALAMLERLESRPLDRVELIRLYAQRATLQNVLGNHDEMIQDLRSLAALTRSYQWPAHVPTEVPQAFRTVAAEVGAPIELRTQARTGEGTVELRASLRGDASILGVEAVIHYRATGAPWRQADGRVRLDWPDGAQIEYFAEAVLPSGTVIASDGARASPRAVSVPSRGGVGAGWWVLGGAAVVLAAAAVVLFFVLRPEDDTRVLSPAFPGASAR